MKFNDEFYEDENGRNLKRSEIDSLGTYEYKTDGFFNWECGLCKNEHSSRGFKIGGTVWTCNKCGKKNLLIRTDFQYLNQILKRSEKNDSEAEDRIRAGLNYLGQAISSLSKKY